MTCDCREKANAALAEHNTKLAVYFTLDSNRIGMPWGIETKQIETGRGKPKAMRLFASFCPLCGISLRKDQTP